MAQLTFGNIATNMSELQRFGYGSYYSDSSPVVTGLTPTVVTARDPVTGTPLCVPIGRRGTRQRKASAALNAQLRADIPA